VLLSHLQVYNVKYQLGGHLKEGKFRDWEHCIEGAGRGEVLQQQQVG
jgi:hypothetical protein